jgi:hypothetical protein
VTGAAVAVAVLLGATAPSTPGASQLQRLACGVERWDVKTLQDPDADKIRLTPRPASVSALRRLTKPASLTEGRIPGVETTVYRVTARLREMKIEEDGDVHLVIADPPRTGR